MFKSGDEPGTSTIYYSIFQTYAVFLYYSYSSANKILYISRVFISGTPYKWDIFTKLITSFQWDIFQIEKIAIITELSTTYTVTIDYAKI